MSNETTDGPSETRDDPPEEAAADRESEPSPDAQAGQQSADEDREAPGDGSQTLAADEQYCNSCGSVVKKQAEICPDCGVRLRDPPAPEKNAGLAAVLSFLVTGLGQIYNGQVGKGIALIVVQFVNALLMFVVVGLLTFPIVWLYGIYDAYVTAERINDGELSP